MLKYSETTNEIKIVTESSHFCRLWSAINQTAQNLLKNNSVLIQLWFYGMEIHSALLTYNSICMSLIPDDSITWREFICFHLTKSYHKCQLKDFEGSRNRHTLFIKFRKSCYEVSWKCVHYVRRWILASKLEKSCTPSLFSVLGEYKYPEAIQFCRIFAVKKQWSTNESQLNLVICFRKKTAGEKKVF